MGAVRQYAIECGLETDASEDELDDWCRRQHGAGHLTLPKWAELLADEREQLLSNIADSALQSGEERHAATWGLRQLEARLQPATTAETADDQRLHHLSVAAQKPSHDFVRTCDTMISEQHPPQMKGNPTMLKDTHVQPSMLFAASVGQETARGQVDVKAPSARYSAKRAPGVHVKSGQAVLRGGMPVELPSEREHALIGAYFRHLALRSRIDVRPLSEHERDLLKELANDHLWCGDVGGQHFTGAPLAAALGRKGTDFIDDSTSGGASLVPYFFDTDIVTFPLLGGELFPMVDLRELGTSNQVKTGSLANPTSSWSSNEGSATSIPLQTTDGIVAGISASVFNIGWRSRSVGISSRIRPSMSAPKSPRSWANA